MASNQSISVSVIVFFLLAVFSTVTATTFIAGDVLQSHGPTGRNLLQAKKKCEINFESMNYTIITSQCKGPQYNANFCCSALKEFACPHAESLNDLSSDCASTMFSYINLYGKYPPGLFAHECREGKEGLVCPAEPPNSGDANHIGQGFSHHALVLSGFFVAFLLG
ncbi:GPI-anchored protein LLG1 [Elaeis guineensis]|uniref:GPI-anchored protein LLG1 n=1 Tax=Elaeis guineensis var. tenera TaxID=51953 RepID=A0A6I9QKT6_ELAGV|nr:GPI-anchored protein LLG1 [Elaeis guineensis]